MCVCDTPNVTPPEKRKWVCPKCGLSIGWAERVRAEVTDAFDGDRESISTEIDRKNIIEIYCIANECSLEVKDVN